MSRVMTGIAFCLFMIAVVCLSVFSAIGGWEGMKVEAVTTPAVTEEAPLPEPQHHYHEIQPANLATLSEIGEYTFWVPSLPEGDTVERELRMVLPSGTTKSTGIIIPPGGDWRVAQNCTALAVVQNERTETIIYNFLGKSQLLIEGTYLEDQVFSADGQHFAMTDLIGQETSFIIRLFLSERMNDIWMPGTRAFVAPTTQNTHSLAFDSSHNLAYSISNGIWTSTIVTDMRNGLQRPSEPGEYRGFTYSTGPALSQGDDPSGSLVVKCRVTELPSDT
ncbi:MAG: hypothetical protein M3Q81_00300 [bacterium]|nr:hypothetical protein [bacterium]